MPLSQPHMQGLHCVEGDPEIDTCQRCAVEHSQVVHLNQDRSKDHLQKKRMKIKIKYKNSGYIWNQWNEHENIQKIVLL